MLQKLEYRVTTAEGGRQALNLLSEQSSTFTLLLVDILMPDIDGIQLLRIFKRAQSRDIPIIMISSSEDPETIAQCFQSGAADFLQKPINFEVLKNRVKVCETLRLEREKRSKLVERVKQQERELQQIKSQISDAIETPMQVVVKECADLLQGTHSAEQYKGALVAILRSLGSRDLYKPAFSNIVDRKAMDSKTFRWLQSELLNESYDKSLDQQDNKAAAKAPSGVRRRSSLPTDLQASMAQQQPSVPLSSQSQTPPSSEETTKEAAEAVVELKKTIPNLELFAFDVYDYTQEELIENVAYMFDSLGLIEEFGISTTKLFSLLRKVQESYKDANPYHNFWHAIDVTQFVYACMNLDRISAFLTPLDVFSLLVASLCHDLDHPGLNNTFQINAQTSLATLYNDISVLENHHASLCFSILYENEYCIIEGLTREESREFRKKVISNILATDMAHHFEIISRFQTRLQTLGSLSKDNSDDRCLLMNIIIKCADISNAVRPFPIARKWAEKVVEEFLQQGDREKEMGLQVSPLMDRESMDKVQLQINFIGYLVEPLFKALVQYIPSAGLLLSTMQTNRKQWAKYLEKQQKDVISPDSPAQLAVVPQKVVEPIVDDFDEEIVAKTRGFNILVVGPHASSNESIQDILSKNGYETQLARSLTDALPLVRRLHPAVFDTIVLDVSDWDMNEIVIFAKEVRNFGVREKHYTPILGLVNPEFEDDSIEGVNFILKKPVQAKQFMSQIEVCIDISMDYTEPVQVRAAIDQSGVDESFVRELLDLLIEDGQSKVAELRQYAAVLDWANLKLQAHSLKGAAAQLACKPLAQAAFVIERAGKLRQEEGLDHALDRLERRLDELQRFVETLP